MSIFLHIHRHAGFEFCEERKMFEIDTIRLGDFLPAFLSGYNRERPFSDIQKRIYPYLYAVINAFWNADIIWNDNSLRNSVEAGDKESISVWMKKIDRRIHTLPEIPLAY